AAGEVERTAIGVDARSVAGDGEPIGGGADAGESTRVGLTQGAVVADAGAVQAKAFGGEGVGAADLNLSAAEDRAAVGAGQGSAGEKIENAGVHIGVARVNVGVVEHQCAGAGFGQSGASADDVVEGQRRSAGDVN